MTARGNGLHASAYAVLIEIEEALGDRLLSALAERQIAAYVVPADGPGGATRLILHVDAQRRIPAGIVLAGLTPALAGEKPAEGEQPAESPPPTATSGLADEVVFAELVAGFHRTPTERTWPAAEDLTEELPLAPPPPPAAPAPPFDPASSVDRRRPVGPSRAQPPARTPKEQAPQEQAPDEEEHYSPPPLPRLDRPPRVIRWALLGLGIGLTLLLLPTLLSFGHQTGLDVVGVLCMLGSTGLLLSRLRDRSPDDPDDGAVV